MSKRGQSIVMMSTPEHDDHDLFVSTVEEWLSHNARANQSRNHEEDDDDSASLGEQSHDMTDPERTFPNHRDRLTLLPSGQTESHEDHFNVLDDNASSTSTQSRTANDSSQGPIFLVSNQTPYEDRDHSHDHADDDHGTLVDAPTSQGLTESLRLFPFVGLKIVLLICLIILVPIAISLDRILCVMLGIVVGKFISMERLSSNCHLAEGLLTSPGAADSPMRAW